jgi:hypothetical protein
MVGQLHDHDGAHRVGCREQDAAWRQVVAAKHLEALRAGWRIGQYVERMRAALQSEEMTAEQRGWLEAHIKEHEEWFAASVLLLEAERDRASARLSKKG